MKNLLFIFLLFPLAAICQDTTGTRTVVNVIPLPPDTTVVHKADLRQAQAAIIDSLDGIDSTLKVKADTTIVLPKVVANNMLSARVRYDTLNKMFDARTAYNILTFAKIDTLNRFIDTARFRIAVAGYPSKTQADNLYQGKGNYLIPTDTNYLHNLAAAKLDATVAANSYQPKGSYLVPTDTVYLHNQNTATATANTANGTAINSLNTAITNINTALAGKFNNPAGNSSQYLNGAGTPVTFPTIPSTAGLLSSTTAAATYQPLLGFTPYNATNPAGYISASALAPYKQIIDSNRSNTAYTTGYQLNKVKDSLAALIPTVFSDSSASVADSSVFYLTTNKLSTGTALFTAKPVVSPVINNLNGIYTYGWTISADFKKLVVRAKVATNTAVIALLGIAVLGSSTAIPTGTVIQVIVK